MSKHTFIHRLNIALVIMLFALKSNNLYAQQDIQPILQVTSNQKLHDWQKLLRLRELKAKHKTNGFYWLTIQKYASVFGDYKTHQEANIALKKIWKQSVSDQIPKPLEEALRGKKFKVLDVEKVIDSIASLDQHQIIIINELHTEPTHRKLLLHLLEPLYKKGFRYVFAEAINPEDTLLNKRGYFLKNRSGGVYIQEPVYGQLVRKAIKTGFKVQGYDIFDPEKGIDTNFRKHGISFEGSDFEIQNQIREWTQAKNIFQNSLKKDPKAKIIILAGMQHAYKSPIPLAHKKEYLTMGVLLSKLSGINPFVVDQNQNVNEVSMESYRKYYDKLIAGHLIIPETPVCILDNSQGGFLKATKNSLYKKFCDLTVFHPYHHFIRDLRPEWMVDFQGRKELRVYPDDIPQNSLPEGQPYLLQAFYLEEDPTIAIPVDQVEISSPNGVIPLLFLPSDGGFKLSVLDSKGRRWPLKRTFNARESVKNK